MVLVAFLTATASSGHGNRDRRGFDRSYLLECLLPNVHEIYAFPIILLFSLVGSVLGTLLTQPTGDEDMKSFYSRVRPWGFWKPVHEMVVRDNPEFKGNQQFRPRLL
jgi:hypothetical protein